MVEQARKRDWIARLRFLYEGSGAAAFRFRYGLLGFDLVTLAFIVATSFLPRTDLVEGLDMVFGVGMAADVAARLVISRRPWRELLKPLTIIDLVVIASFLAPIPGEGAAFLRILRTLRVLHSYQVLSRLREDSAWFRRYEDIIIAVVNLSVFILVMTGIVYETQYPQNPHIENYADALYFTVTALTTTGFGDITLPGTTGRLISVVIMICGVTLFLRLAQVLFRPNKVRYPCPACGLQRHEPDAVHCKACGHILNIPDEGN